MGVSNSIGEYIPGKPSLDSPPTIHKISCEEVEKLYLNSSYLLIFKVSGIGEENSWSSYDVVLEPSDPSIQLFTSKNEIKTTFTVKKGWKFSIYIRGNKIINNASISVKVDSTKVLTIPISIHQDKDVFSNVEVKRLLEDYKKSRSFNDSGNVVGNGYCINAADKGIGALLNDTINFYTEPNLKSQGGNGVRLLNATSRGKVFQDLNYVKENFTITTDNFGNSDVPTKWNQSLELKFLKSINKKIGYHVYYFTMHGEYHVMVLVINYLDPCNVTFSILDQGYVNSENQSFKQVDLIFLLLEQKLWSNKPKHAKDIQLWKIKRR